MRKITSISFVCVLVCLAGIVGCDNPAEGKPEAKVAEPAASTTPASMEGATYVISPDSTIGFVGSKVTGSHDGGFNAFSGKIMLVDGKPEASSVSVKIDTTSLWADNDKLTGHLKSADFFDVENFPGASFTSTAIVPEGDGYTITGNLDLHGVEKSISFPASIDVSGDAIRAQAEFVINRFDFEILYKGKADDLIRDEVVIKLDLVATPQT